MTERKGKMSYLKAGVSIENADLIVRKISPTAKKTFSRSVIHDIGGFSAFFQPDLSSYKKPVLLATTDGVGTKVMVAIAAGKFDGIGIDLVAMCVNDLIVHGGKPLFFLDYYASSQLRTEEVSAVVKSIAKGCILSKCALIGGETAEMPSLYKPGDFDMAGFCVGLAERKNIITGKSIMEGDILLGLKSSGFHSNGYSLIRSVVFDRQGFQLDDIFPGTKHSVSKVLLTPTRIYVQPLLSLISKITIKGMAHITGGGLEGNVARILPSGLKAVIRSSMWRRPTVFTTLQQLGNIDDEEMFKTFNMGIGIVLVTDEKSARKAISFLKQSRISSFVIGEVKNKRVKDKSVEVHY